MYLKALKMNPILFHKEQGYTFIEIIIALFNLLVIVAAIVHYHSTSGVSGNQVYDLKAVDVLHSEANKLEALYRKDKDLDEFSEISVNLPEEIFLFRVNSNQVEVPSPIHNVYYSPHSALSIDIIKSLDNNNTINDYHKHYDDAFKLEYSVPSDTIDLRTFTFCTYDSAEDPPSTADTDSFGLSNPSTATLDVSIVVSDDMGSPDEPEDDLLGYIGWWVEKVDLGSESIKNVTIALQYWYPGADWKAVDPEVIVLKTTMH